jgi:hypothetical protein
MMNVVDALNLLNFQSYYVAAGTIGKDWKKIFQKAPKPGDRPRYEDTTTTDDAPKKKFLSGAELKQMMNGGVVPAKYVVEHSEACIKAKRTTEVNCGCERKPVIKKK